ILLPAGTRGRRFALPSATIHMHQPWSSGGGGQASDIEIQAREIIRQRDLLNQILVARTGQPLSRIEEATDRDGYMTAQAAVDYGLIDGVLDPPDKGESKAQAKSEGKSK